jgi:hypothetical protein
LCATAVALSNRRRDRPIASLNYCLNVLLLFSVIA